MKYYYKFLILTRNQNIKIMWSYESSFDKAEKEVIEMMHIYDIYGLMIGHEIYNNKFEQIN